MTPPFSIGHYQATAKIGEGGMGAVYHAMDTRLSRGVAIKISPDGLANDPEYLARVHWDAQVLASLNHPNIAILHGVEEKALVMELVEGAELPTPVPIREALAERDADGGANSAVAAGGAVPGECLGDRPAVRPACGRAVMDRIGKAEDARIQVVVNWRAEVKGRRGGLRHVA